MAKKIGRNDPCPCGSGKKFKKCCESKYIGKKYRTEKIQDTSLGEKAGFLTSFFKNRVVEPLSKTKPAEEENESGSNEESSEKKESEQKNSENEKPD